MNITNRDTRNIVASVLILTGIGTVMVYSSTALMSMRQYGNSLHYLWKHVFTVLGG